ncbi:DUF11 domain-containing protein, partial [cf. Phormidesmis sp. LEGE 11477]|uniref:DUF11 domain-containing protein n=1 Tax=cf. Phormidesmis sp. LEGE 11477 TaxID=1828680 RepID=UPI001882664A
SKRGGLQLSNTIIEATIQTDPATGRAIGVGPANVLSRIPRSEFPVQTDSIDGIAIAPDGTVFGVANRGVSTERAASSQILVTIDINTGQLEERGTFTFGGAEIDDVEDLNFDLFGNLFAISGSNFNDFTNNAFVIPLDADGNALDSSQNIPLREETGRQDYEAAACLPFVPDGSLIVVKRITAITRNGENVPITGFDDQLSDTDDNLLFEETDGTLPVGLVAEQTALSPGDEVEYTVYVYNPSSATLENAILCDPLRQPNVLQDDSIEYSEPSVVPNGGELAFDGDASGFARSPLAAADEACLPLLEGNEFIGGPPAGGVRAGGGVVTDEFSLAPAEVAAIRFRVSVGQFDEDAVEPGEDAP